MVKQEVHKWQRKKWRDVIYTRRGYLVVDTNNTFDAGWETMVFTSHDPQGFVTCYEAVDVDRYADEASAEAGHQAMIEKWRI